MLLHRRAFPIWALRVEKVLICLGSLVDRRRWLALEPVIAPVCLLEP